MNHPKSMFQLSGVHYKGGLYGISLSLFLLVCFFGALVQALGFRLESFRVWGLGSSLIRVQRLWV